MRLKIIVSILALTGLFGATGLAKAQSLPFPPDEYFVGEILSVEPGRQEELLGAFRQFLNVQVLIRSGELQDKEIVIEDEDRFAGDSAQWPQPGDQVVVVRIWNNEQEFFYRIDDHYRLPALGWIFAVFLALVIFFGRKKGLGAIVGLSISVLILRYYVIPRLMSGESPALTTFIGSLLIVLFSTVCAHGFMKRTYVALGSTLITLSLSVLFAQVFVRMARLFGAGSEEAFYLQMSGVANFNLQGLLLGGIIIGMLGILDDVTTAQSAAVEEIQKANTSFSFRELYRRGISVGKEHIASLVNTLVLAYVGASLPLFMLFVINSAQVPAWVLLNGEFIAEEVVRALAGSVALVLAVPISTMLAARVFSRRQA